MKKLTQELLERARKQVEQIDNELENSDADYETAYCKLRDVIEELV